MTVGDTAIWSLILLLMNIMIIIIMIIIIQIIVILCHIIIYIYNIEPHEAVPEVSRSKVHITQNKHVPIEWFVTTASQSRI